MTDAISHQAPEMNTAPSSKVRVWDRWPGFSIGVWSRPSRPHGWLRTSSNPVHEFAGYTVAGLVAFRLVWGRVGSRYARFAQFLRGPGETLAYLGDMTRGRERRYLGHNPAGAAMVVALLITLSGTAFTGWLMEDEARLAILPSMPAIVAPAWADDDGDGDGDGDEREYGARGEVEGPKEVHETLANLMLLLAALHVGGVVLTSFRHHENLARAMVTGDKRGPGPGDIA